MNVKTRFAPSPTGYLHLGGARTALFNYLWAKKHSGQFLLRFEDTDVNRTLDNAYSAITDGLKWLGLNWDNAFIPKQSDFTSIYKTFADELISKGAAYEKDGAIYFAASKREQTSFDDAVFGRRTSNSNSHNDFVIIRSSGLPLYNFSCVIDDHLTDISHVIRGRDHLENTNHQAMIYDAFGWNKPVFAHCPMMMANKSEKLSKRHGAVSVEEYQKNEYDPTGLLSYLIRFGWSHGDDELFSMEEMINYFDIENILKKDGIFDFKKCEAINKKWKRKYVK